MSLHILLVWRIRGVLRVISVLLTQVEREREREREREKRGGGGLYNVGRFEL